MEEDVNEKIQTLLGEVIVSQLEAINNMPIGERTRPIADLGKLHTMKSKEEQFNWDAEKYYHDAEEDKRRFDSKEEREEKQRVYNVQLDQAKLNEQKRQFDKQHSEVCAEHAVQHMQEARRMNLEENREIDDRKEKNKERKHSTVLKIAETGLKASGIGLSLYGMKKFGEMFIQMLSFEETGAFQSQAAKMIINNALRILFESKTTWL